MTYKSSVLISRFTLGAKYIMLGHTTYESARNTHNLDHDDIILVHRGDASSNQTPYRMMITHDLFGWVRYLDANGNEQTAYCRDLKVFVYRKRTRFDTMPPDQQIDELEAFALQFPEGSLIREFITYQLIQWLRRNHDDPNIWRKLVQAKNALYRQYDDAEEMVE